MDKDAFFWQLADGRLRGRFAMKWLVYAVALLVMTVGSSTAWGAPRKFEEISMERWGCYGTCPIYKITATADGTVTYEGEQWVKAVGKHTKHLSRARVKRIAKAITDLEFFSLRDQYESRKDGCQAVATDSAGATIVVKAGGETKSVRRWHRP